jgi:CheY-like chemotaxis protein
MGSTKRLLLVPATLLGEAIDPSFLDRAAVRVRTATSGVEALALTRCWRPDLIVFSSVLPDATVAELVEHLRSDGEFRGRLLVVEEAVGTTGPEVAVDGRLVAPVEHAALLGAIAALLDLDQRSSPRVAVHVLARLEGATETRLAAHANVLSLSASGALIEAPAPLEHDTTIALELVLPGTAIQLHLAARVRVLIDEILLHYGVEFVDVEPAARDALARFVAKHRVAAPPEGSTP